MLFVITAIDKPNCIDLRMATRAAHLQYLADAGDRIKLGGPLQSEGDDPQPVGSMIVIEAASEGAVRLFAQNDPYTAAGLFESVTIKPFKAVTGSWLGSTE